MISVVVPTYNSKDSLRECLQALKDQTIRDEEYEVIVVDDGSTDGTEELKEQYPIRYVAQSQCGPAAARNKGLSLARGEIVLFIDADCVPTPHLVSTVKDGFRREDIVGLKGFYRSTQKEWVARFAQAEYEYKYLKILQNTYIDFVDTYAAAYRKDLLEREGGFDQQFPVASGEDIDLSYRLSELGYKMIAHPDMVVYHRHPDSLAKYLRRKYKVGFWRALLYKKHVEKIFSDSHTPFSIKFEVAALLVIGALLILSLWNSALLIAVLGVFALYTLSSLPFLFFCFQRDRMVGLLGWPVIFLRDVALVEGLFAGNVTPLFHSIYQPLRKH